MCITLIIDNIYNTYTDCLIRILTKVRLATLSFKKLLILLNLFTSLIMNIRLDNQDIDVLHTSLVKPLYNMADAMCQKCS